MAGGSKVSGGVSPWRKLPRINVMRKDNAEKWKVSSVLTGRWLLSCSRSLLQRLDAIRQR